MTETTTRKQPTMTAIRDPSNEPVLEFLITNIVLRAQNVRSEYTDMDALSASIRAEGIIQPLTLVHILDDKKVPTGKGELIAGYRRYFAAKKSGLKTVPVRFVNADEHRRHRLAMIENLQRVDMNPMDRAVGIQKMLTDEELDQVESTLEELYPEGMPETSLNDLFWFDFKSVCEWLGLDEDEYYER